MKALKAFRWYLAKHVNWLLVALLIMVVTQPDASYRDGRVVITLGPPEAYAAGTADYSLDGLADDVEVQAALNALPNQGGLLHFKAGTYNLTANVTRAIGNVTIEGEGRNVLFTGSGSFVAGGNQWVFRDMALNVTTQIDMGATTGWRWSNVFDSVTLYDERNPSYSVIGGAVVVTSVNATTVNGTQGTFATGNFATLNIGNNLTLSQSGSVYNLALTIPSEFRVTQNNNYDAASQYPALQIQQLGTGEAIFRIIHADDTGSTNWIFGQLGRTGNNTHSDFYLGVDGLRPMIQSTYATNNSAGRVRFGWNYFDTEIINSRVEIKGGMDSKQLVIRGFSTQTNDIFQVLNSNNNTLLSVTNNLTLLGVSGLGFAVNPTTTIYYVGPGSIGIANNLRVDTSFNLGGNPSGVAGLAELPTVVATSLNGTTVNTTQLRFTPIATPSAVTGYMYYDSTNNTILFYNGTTWKTILTN